MSIGFGRGLPFFYGWVIVAVAMLSCLLGAGLNNISMAVVFKPITEDLSPVRRSLYTVGCAHLPGPTTGEAGGNRQ